MRPSSAITSQPGTDPLAVHLHGEPRLNEAELDGENATPYTLHPTPSPRQGCLEGAVEPERECCRLEKTMPRACEQRDSLWVSRL